MLDTDSVINGVNTWENEVERMLQDKLSTCDHCITTRSVMGCTHGMKWQECRSHHEVVLKSFQWKLRSFFTICLSATSVSNVCFIKYSGNSSNSKKQSTLSVNAPVFIPKYTTQAANLSVTAAEFVPRNPFPAYTHTQNPDNLYEDFQRLVNIQPTSYPDSQVSPSKSQIIEAFKASLYQLTIRPGEMEVVMRPMVDMLLQCDDDSIVQDIIELLFEQCVSEPNFRYTGARLCKYLSTELTANKIFLNFRSQFLTRCKEEYLKKEELVANPGSINRLCGFTMFIGELFLNLELESKTGPQKIGILRIPVLRDLLLILLSHPTDFTVKCAMQLLKLTGATIEDTAHLNKPEDGSYDEVFLQIRALNSYPSLNETSKCLIKSVLSLKDNNWGRTNSRSSTSSVSSQDNTSHQYYNQPQYAQIDPVFYNDKGQPITAQEAGYFNQEYEEYDIDQEAEEYEHYLAAGQNGNVQWDAAEDIGEPHWDQGMGYQHWSHTDEIPYNTDYYQGARTYEENYMDDEMEAAYEEFLRQQVQGHR
ncbi:hypothetical protein FSP39_012897 [Pinctada imbricata]|uniref:MIF4G domain-containing protein n=1 Tax=Pinctada imbricata TaxID=66713 RepID=A0AA88Y6W0_PINIB|nr:hypothetical protein FSP39_012897 [Pinctada imbricata]